jgi:hypothetical protein
MYYAVPKTEQRQPVGSMVMFKSEVCIASPQAVLAIALR